MPRQQRPPASSPAVQPPAKRRGCLYYAGMGLLAFLAISVCGAIANIVNPRTPASPAPERAAVLDVSQETPATPAPAEPSPAAAIIAATATIAPPTATQSSPTATPAPAIFGSDLAAWVASYGKPTERVGYQVFGPWEILLLGDQVRHIERIYDPPVPVADALAAAATLLPADAILQRTYSPDGSPEVIVDLYTSASLAARLPADAWRGGEPGQFVVIHHAYPEEERRIIIAAGNNATGGEPPTSTPPQATATPTPPIIGAVVGENANLRSGPGTDYAVVGGAVAGDQIAPVGRNIAGDWLQLANGAWIAAALVLNPPGDLPVTAAAPVVATSAAAAPIEAQPNAFTCVGGCAIPPDSSCAIKGNVNSKGELIYHMPGWRDYNRTDIKPEEGDRWFCTPEEAQNAGFRAPLNP